MKQIIFILLVLFSINMQAQVGYQVSLLNKATGEPRANETVTVEVKITDSKDNVIYSGSQSATTNDFGVLSLSVGNADTFNNVDWNNLPLYVSATVDNVLLGRSQILSVPVAEHAKHTGTLTKEILMSKTWRGSAGYYLTFTESVAKFHYSSFADDWRSYDYYIQGNLMIMKEHNERKGELWIYIPDLNGIMTVGRDHDYYFN